MDTTLGSVADYFGRVYRLRYFWASLVRNDLINRYRRSFLGIAWSLVRPVGMTIVLCVVFTTLLDQPIEKIAPMIFVGVATWQFLVESMIGGCTCFIAGAAYIRQQSVPLFIFPLRVVLGSAIHTGVALSVAVLVTTYFQGIPAAPLLLSVIPALVLLFLIGVMLACIFGMLHTHFPDTQHFLEIMLQMLVYLTPVMYPMSLFDNRPAVRRLIKCNPFASVLELVRKPLVEGVYPEPFNIAFAVGFLVLLTVVAWVFLRKVEKSLVFWV